MLCFREKSNGKILPRMHCFLFLTAPALWILTIWGKVFRIQFSLKIYNPPEYYQRQHHDIERAESDPGNGENC